MCVYMFNVTDTKGGKIFFGAYLRLQERGVEGSTSHTHTNTKGLKEVHCTHTHTHTNTKGLKEIHCTHTHIHTHKHKGVDGSTLHIHTHAHTHTQTQTQRG